MKSASFDLEDFLAQLRMIKRMGPLENLLGMIPGAANLPSPAVNGKELQRVEAIILSMTPGERKRPCRRSQNNGPPIWPPADSFFH